MHKLTTDLTTESFVNRVESDKRIQRIVRPLRPEDQKDVMQAVRMALFQAKRKHDSSRGVSKRHHAVTRATGAAMKARDREVQTTEELAPTEGELEEALRRRIIEPGRGQLTPEQAVELGELRRLVAEATRVLPNPKQRECLRAWLRDEPWAEVAARLGVREDYCRALKADGLKRLSRALAGGLCGDADDG